MGLYMVYVPFWNNLLIVPLLTEDSEDRKQQQAREQVQRYGRRLTA